MRKGMHRVFLIPGGSLNVCGLMIKVVKSKIVSNRRFTYFACQASGQTGDGTSNLEACVEILHWRMYTEEWCRERLQCFLSFRLSNA